ncbi:MAG: ABC transporter substrate-binding protein, partial [[Clostridium] symbiosum]
SVQAESLESADASASAEETASEDVSSENASDGAENNSEGAVRVGSLKGPTSMGLVSLMNSDTSANQYDFRMVTAADELVASIASGKLDIALVPANVASVLYNKTEGGISVIDINTLGVLYIVSADDSIKSVADLKGRTVYLTGKGTTPDYVIQYLLKANGLSEQDVKLEYKSEAAEVAAILKEKPDSIGLLPQPFVTVACAQNETLKIVLDLTAEWDKVQGAEGSRLVTGVTIVTNEFLKNNEEAVKVFLSDHKVSAKAAVSDPKTTAEQIVQAGIIEKAPIAQKALPYCNITFIEGEEMKAALSGYLNVLFEQDPKSVGGKLPADNFYYIEK